MDLLRGYNYYSLWNQVGELNREDAAHNPVEAHLTIEGKDYVIPLMLKISKEGIYFVERKEER